MLILNNGHGGTVYLHVGMLDDGTVQGIHTYTLSDTRTAAYS